MPVEVTLDNIAATIEKNGIVLLDFWAAWCGPCRAFAPVFEAAAQAHPDLVFGKIDTEAQPELAASFNVRAIPTLAVFRDGVLVFAQPGMLSGPMLEKLIAAVRALDMAHVTDDDSAAQ